MPWLDEPDSYQSGLMNHNLYSGDAIEPALIEFWTRILDDAIANARVIPWKYIALDILERQYEEDEKAYLHAAFVDGANKNCKGVSQYFLRHEHYTCLHADDEDSSTFNRTQLLWYLDQYKQVKNALNHPNLSALLEKVQELHPLEVHAATAFGWFDIQFAEDEFGVMSQNDQLLLDGQATISENPFTDLMPGPPPQSAPPSQIQAPPSAPSSAIPAMQVLAEALIGSIPNARLIHCKITQGLLYGKRSLFYEIESPQVPDAIIDSPEEPVQKAATSLVKLMNPNDGLFPGLEIKLEMLPDGSWKNSFELLSVA